MANFPGGSAPTSIRAVPLLLFAAVKLRTHLLLIVFGTAVPVIGLSIFLAGSLADHELELFQKRATERARAVMSAVEAEVRGHVSTLDAIAVFDEIKKGDLRAFHAEMVATLATQPNWRNLTLLDPEGQQLVNASKAFGGPLPSGADVPITHEVVKTGRFAVGNIVVGPVLGVHGIPVRVPVHRDGKIAYVLSAFLKPEVFSHLIAQQELQPGWVIGLIDKEGGFVARFPPRPLGSKASREFRAASQSGSSGWYRGLTVDGQDTFTAFVVSPSTGWALGQAIPVADIQLASRHAAQQFGAGVLACLLLALGIAYLLGRRVTEPIETIAESARALSAGSVVPPPPPVAVTELSDVARALFDASQAVREREVRLERQAAELRAADNAKNEFVAMLSHELRNPLNALTTSSYVLATAGSTDPKVLYARGVIERQTRNMTRLVSDLLDASRLALGKEQLEREPFDLAELVEHVVKEWDHGRDSDPARVLVSVSSVWVKADRLRMEQVLVNLLDNARKFSPAGTQIRVSTGRQAGDAVMVVADEGEGLTADLAGRVFDLFVQADQGLDRTRGGMGIGLALVKRIAELHGGAISVQSAGRGQGATFRFSLPATEAPAPAVQTPAPGSVAGARPVRILIVEDNEDARESLRMLLESEGHEVLVAGNADEALGRVDAQRPAVALIDIGLPGRDGYEIARAIRSGANGSRMKLIALTGYGQADDQRRATEAGFDRHLTKPVSPPMLFEVVAAVVRELDR